ncbi:MAG: NADPH-dependent F420 reductase [Archaeoglobaceae archaeon]|nr:NADPH-dependent F420 reductase [Archaeoglobaceae archaeon]
MKIAILGGTGDLGIGLSLRLAIAGHEVIVGSRSEEKAKSKAEEYKKILSSKGLSGNIIGTTNQEASKLCDIAIVTVPWEQAFTLAESLKSELAGKVVVSPIVPMKREGKFFRYVELPEGSAAEKIAGILKDSKVVSAYHNIPAERFANLDENFEWDVVVCGNDKEAKEIVLRITKEIKGLNAFDGGDLKNSRLVESLTALILNVMVNNKLKELGIKFR